MSFFDRFFRTRKSLRQEALAQTPISYAPQPGDIKLPGDLALLVIDVQREFCDPNGERGNKETVEISQRIRRLVPAFRKAGVPVYVIYCSDEEKQVQDVDFYEFRPREGDFVLCKKDDSAFNGTTLDEKLKEHHRRTLLTCGFNTNACIYATVMDARAQGYSVRLLRDLTGNDNNNDAGSTPGYVRRMQEEGVVISNAADELRALAARNPRTRAEKHCRPRARNRPAIA